MHPIGEHGRQLSDTEYERLLVDLHRGQPAMPTAAKDTELRRRELDLVIDHRLGTGFPRERRDALWSVHQRVEKKRRWMAVGHFVRSVLPRFMAAGDQRLAASIFDAYATVLSAREIEAFLGVTNRDAAALPIEPPQSGAAQSRRHRNGA